MARTSVAAVILKDAPYKVKNLNDLEFATGIKKKKRTYYHNQVALPAGKVPRGERLPVWLRKEIKQETGLRVRLLSKKPVRLKHPSGDKYTSFYLCVVVGKKRRKKNSKELRNIRFRKWGKLRGTGKMARHHQRGIRALLKRCRFRGKT